MSTFMSSSNTPEVEQELAELLLCEEGSEWAENTTRHFELAKIILNNFEVLSKTEEKHKWAEYVAWINNSNG